MRLKGVAKLPAIFEIRWWADGDRTAAWFKILCLLNWNSMFTETTHMFCATQPVFWGIEPACLTFVCISQVQSAASAVCQVTSVIRPPKIECHSVRITTEGQVWLCAPPLLLLLFQLSSHQLSSCLCHAKPANAECLCLYQGVAAGLSNLFY